MKRLPALVPPVVALVVHLSSLPGDFVFDDVPLIEEDAAIRNFDLRRVFWDSYFGHRRLDVSYRPVAKLSYALNCQISEEAWPFHLVNVLLNALVVWLVYLVFLEILRTPVLASLAASVYAVLPIHTEAVANIIGRTELLATVAVLAVWLLSLRNPADRRTLPAIFAAGVLLLGLGAKESALVAIPVAAASSWILRREVPWKTAGACLAAFGLYMVLREFAVAENLERIRHGSAVLNARLDNPLIEVGGPARALNGLALLNLYAWKTLAPISLSADYSYNQIPVRELSDPTLWLGASTFVVAIVAGYWVFRRRQPIVALALVLFPIGFAVTSNVLFPIGTAFGERLAYFPSLSLALLAGGASLPHWRSEAKGRRGRRRVIVGVFIAALVTYSARTIVRNLDWQDRDRLADATAAASPRSARAHILSAAASLRRTEDAGTSEERLVHIRSAFGAIDLALEIDPGNPRARAKRGLALYFQGRALDDLGEHERAVAAYTSAEAEMTGAAAELAERKQSEPEFFLVRSSIRLQLKEFASARDDIVRFVVAMRNRRGEVKPAVYRSLAFAEISLGHRALFGNTPRLKEAEGLFRSGLRQLDRAEAGGDDHFEIDFFRGLGHAMLAEVAGRRGDADAKREGLRRALELFSEAARAAPDNPEVWNNRGFARELLGDTQGAIDDYRRGLEACRKKRWMFRPGQESAHAFHLRLALILERSGRLEEAARERAHARELEATSQPAR